MSLASKRYVEKRLMETRRPIPPRRLEASGGSGMDWSEAMFGYEINPDGDNALEVRIMAGRIGDVVVAQADVVLSSDAGDYYVWVRRTKSNDTVLVQSGADWPEDDATYAYYVLHRFTVADEVASIHTVIRPLLRDRLQVDGTGLQYQVFQVDDTGAIIVDWLRAGP
jgi:hypothetical protein